MDDYGNMAKRKLFFKTNGKKCRRAKHSAHLIYIDSVERAIDKCYSNYKGIHLLCMQSHLAEPTFHCKIFGVNKMNSPHALSQYARVTKITFTFITGFFFIYVIIMVLENIYLKGS